MYILKNSLKNIHRSPIRSLLISVIIILISTVCCISLSLFRSADKATNDVLKDSSVIAKVVKGDILGSIDASESLTYGEIKEFSRSEYVYETYIECESEIDLIGSQLIHTAIGYSSVTAAKYFRHVEKLITQGVAFDPWSATPECAISSTLALNLGISLGDTISLSPRGKNEVYEFIVTGFLQSTELTKNDILFGFNVFENMFIIDEQTAINSAFSINHPDNIKLFRDYVSQNTMGENTYRAFFSGVQKFRNAFYPMQSTKSIASLILILSLLIGCSILIIISILNTNERKYEVGVLSAMGMPKKGIIAQFVSETLFITVVSVVIGILIAIPFSVMSTRSLLAPTVYTNMTLTLRIQVNLNPVGNSRLAHIGYETDATSNPDLITIMSKTTNILNTIKAVISIDIVLYLVGIGLFLAFISSFASIVFVARFDSLKLLGERVS